MTSTNPKRRTASVEVTDMPPNMRKTPYGYEYRRVVPADVRAIIGQWEFKETLGKNFQTAKAKWAELEAESTRKIAEARAVVAAKHDTADSDTLEARQIEAFLKRPFISRRKRISATVPGLADQLSALWLALLEDDLTRRRTGELDEEDFEELDENVAEMLPAINRALATGKVDAYVEVINNLLSGKGYELNATQEDMQRLTYDVLKHVQTAYKLLAARQQGELIKPDLSMLPAPLPAAWETTTKTEKTSNTQPHRLSHITPILEEDLKAVGRKQQTTNISIWQRLVDFCSDKSLADVTSNDIYQFLHSRLHDPADPWTKNYTSRAKNVLKRAFGLAKTKNLLTHNPVSEMETFPRINKEIDAQRRMPRFPYNTEQLNRIFSSEWYDPDSETWRGKMRYDLGARYWGPLICLFHGLRIREAMQLFTHDIIDDDIPLLKIQVELDKNSAEIERHLKNDSTKRTVPIHPTLLSLGFIDFVRNIKKRSSNRLLFPSSLPDQDSKNPVYGRAYEQALLRFVRDNLGFGHGYGNHSFRHTLEDCIRDVQLEPGGVWPAGLSQFYTGRKLARDADKELIRQQGSEQSYGLGYNPKRIRHHVEKIQFRDVKLPPVFKDWLDGRDAVHVSVLSKLERV